MSQQSLFSEKTYDATWVGASVEIPVTVVKDITESQSLIYRVVETNDTREFTRDTHDNPLIGQCFYMVSVNQTHSNIKRDGSHLIKVSEHHYSPSCSHLTERINNAD